MISGKVLLIASLLLQVAEAAPTKVGNGDDGSDLEGASAIESGPIIDAKQKSLQLLEKLNTAGVRGLGALIPELKNSTILLAKQDSKAKLSEDQNQFHSDMMENVYARTFAEPNAATRFFPAATKLDQEQLTALHIHEALHRSLPVDIREDEAVVSKITLAITTPGATHDQVRRVMEDLVPESNYVQANNFTNAQEVKEKEFYESPSSFGYSLRQFDPYSKQELNYKVTRIHSVQSFLYPFGGGRNALGLGLEASFIEALKGAQMGPLGISARMRVWTFRDFDLHAWSTLYLNTLSDEELKNSPFGRDVFSVGLSLLKESKHWYLENVLAWSSGGKSEETLANTKIKYEYGSVLIAGIHPGLKVGRFRLGAFGEMNLADYFRVNGGLFQYDSGRYRVVTVGPEIAYIGNSFAMRLMGRYMLDATKDASYDYLGNIMGQGVAQGSVMATLKFFL